MSMSKFEKVPMTMSEFKGNVKCHDFKRVNVKCQIFKMSQVKRGLAGPCYKNTFWKITGIKKMHTK